MPFEFAEEYAIPVEGELGPFFTRRNEFNEAFFLRWGRIRFAASWGAEANLKVILKVHRSGGGCEKFIVDTDPYEVEWNRQQTGHAISFFIPVRRGRGG